MDVNTSTPLLAVDTGEYPLYFQHVRAANPNVSFPEPATEDILAEYGFAVVLPTQRPKGDVVTEGKPVLVDGVWTQGWEVRDFTEEELAIRLADLKKRASDRVLDLREQTLNAGFIYTTEDERIFTVQLRAIDQNNLLGLSIKAERLLAAKAETLTKFRSTENESHLLSPAELKRMCDEALATFERVMEASWELKDKILQATTIDALPQLPASLM